jgi:hypothetical protein
MAGNNICPGFGFVEVIEDAEIARRIKLIGAAKRGACGRELTDVELDALVEPTPCRRTRLRLKGMLLRTPGRQ